MFDDLYIIYKVLYLEDQVLDTPALYLTKHSEQQMAISLSDVETILSFGINFRKYTLLHEKFYLVNSVAI